MARLRRWEGGAIANTNPISIAERIRIQREGKAGSNPQSSVAADGLDCLSTLDAALGNHTTE